MNVNAPPTDPEGQSMSSKQDEQNNAETELDLGSMDAADLLANLDLFEADDSDLFGSWHPEGGIDFAVEADDVPTIQAAPALEPSVDPRTTTLEALTRGKLDMTPDPVRPPTEATTTEPLGAQEEFQRISPTYFQDISNVDTTDEIPTWDVRPETDDAPTPLRSGFLHELEDPMEDPTEASLWWMPVIDEVRRNRDASDVEPIPTAEIEPYEAEDSGFEMMQTEEIAAGPDGQPTDFQDMVTAPIEPTASDAADSGFRPPAWAAALAAMICAAAVTAVAVKIFFPV